MVVAVAEGRYLDAYRHARSRNPFASSCGRACDAPCERSCLRAGLDEAVRIRLLERFVCELFGPESVQGADFSLSCSYLHRIRLDSCTPGRVAIVGAGPAGLTAAHDLALLGHRCEVFEKADRAGGRLARLPASVLHPSVLDAEVAAILCLGITLHLSSPVSSGERCGLLASGFDAVIVASGEAVPQDLPAGVFHTGETPPADGSFVHAVAAGSRAAREVHAFLTGRHLHERRTSVLVPLEALERVRPVSRPGGSAVAPPVVWLGCAPGEEVCLEASLPESDALDEAARCVDCHRSAVIEADVCTGCGVCVDICPEDALRVLPSSRVGMTGDGAGFSAQSLLLKDAGRCTRCGWCSAACPEGAISMQVLEVARDAVAKEEPD